MTGKGRVRTGWMASAEMGNLRSEWRGLEREKERELLGCLDFQWRGGCERGGGMGM